MPCDFLDGKLIDIVPAKGDVAGLVVACEVQREDALIERALLVGQFDEQIWSMVTNLDRREPHQTVGDQCMKTCTLAMDAQDVHVGHTNRLAKETFACTGNAQAHCFLDVITPSST